MDNLKFQISQKGKQIGLKLFSQVLICDGLIELFHLEGESEGRNYPANLKVHAISKINKVYRVNNPSCFVAITTFTGRQGFLRTFLVS